MIAEGKCVEREKIFAYVHHMIEPAEEAEIRHHLDQCAHCRQMAEGFEKLSALLEEWKPTEPSPWFDARLRRALATRSPWEIFRFLFHLPAALAFAAVVVVFFVVGSALIVRETDRQRAARPTFPPVVQQTVPRGAQSVANSPQAQTALQPGEEELKLYENLPVLEDYDLLANCDFLSEIPRGEKKVAD